MNRQHKSEIALLGITIAWGASYILTKNALATLPTFNFLAIRFLISTFICVLFFYKRLLKIDRTTLKCGILIGIVMFSAYAFQTIGLFHTTVSKSAFISGFAVVIVPILSAFLLKKAPQLSAVIGVLFAIIGLALLTLNDHLILNIGDFYTLICAFFFALQIIMVSKYVVKIDPINLAILQIAVVGILSLFTTFLFESPIIPSNKDAWINILLLSILCTAGSFIIQNVVQKYTSATHTALIFAGEPVFATIFGYFLENEMISARSVTGGILIILGTLIAELEITLPSIKRKKLKTY